MFEKMIAYLELWIKANNIKSGSSSNSEEGFIPGAVHNPIAPAGIEVEAEVQLNQREQRRLDYLNGIMATSLRSGVAGTYTEDSLPPLPTNWDFMRQSYGGKKLKLSDELDAALKTNDPVEILRVLKETDGTQITERLKQR